ncbi:MAG TPA: hypothetical protein DEO32_06515 [Ruminococcaceae bacterium]|nr:hypothetical protein [Oscillospiraceae bacterium]
MSFCRNCGRQLNDDSSFCPSCGAPVNGNAQQNNQQNYRQYNNSNNQYNNQYQQAPYQTNLTPQEVDVASNKWMACLSYLGIFLLIPMFTRKYSAYCRFHVKQGATLFAIFFVYELLTRIITVVISLFFRVQARVTVNGIYYIPSPITTVFTAVFALGTVFLSVLAIIGIIYCVKGKEQPLPIIGKINFIGDFLDKTVFKLYM